MITRNEALALYRSMRRIRRFEETAGEMFEANQMAGFVHLSIGQEAIAVGVCSQLTERDSIASTHRGHGHCIAKGGQLRQMMAELLGKTTGYCRGRSGSMHIADPTIGILGANAIVGGGIAMAVGAALTAQMTRSGAVSVAFFGEGAVGAGVFHECLNLAALWKLPVLFVCENNQYAELSHVSKHLSAKNVADFGCAYGVPSSTHDGNDVRIVARESAAAVARARVGGGPALLEFQTYRWRGHFEGDQQTYRSNDDLEAWKLRDPLAQLQQVLVGELNVPAAELATADEDVEYEIEEAVAWARTAPDAEVSLLAADVYAAETGHA